MLNNILVIIFQFFNKKGMIELGLRRHTASKQLLPLLQFWLIHRRKINILPDEWTRFPFQSGWIFSDPLRWTGADQWK
ncbi:hypothetical protein GX408_02135 [bacterium]|nr:hypothetical protein [bacterium]